MKTWTEIEIEEILMKAQVTKTEDIIKYLVKIIPNKKEKAFLEIAKQKQPKTKAEVDAILSQILEEDLLDQIVMKLKKIGMSKDEALMIINPIADGTEKQLQKMLEWIESNHYNFRDASKKNHKICNL